MVQCAHCGRPVEKPTGHVNRARKLGMRLFCGRACFGASRRLAVQPTDEERKAAKAAYDREYRARNREKRREQTRAWYAANRESRLVKQAEYNAAHRKEHNEYCRRPEYRTKKKHYDRRYRAGKFYGEFAEAFVALMEVEEEIGSQASKYERYLQNGTLNKKKRRA